jgi:hypothetical protein
MSVTLIFWVECQQNQGRNVDSSCVSICTFAQYPGVWTAGEGRELSQHPGSYGTTSLNTNNRVCYPMTPLHDMCKPGIVTTIPSNKYHTIQVPNGHLS